jgi:hypothetical protein
VRHTQVGFESGDERHYEAVIHALLDEAAGHDD